MDPEELLTYHNKTVKYISELELELEKDLFDTIGTNKDLTSIPIW